MAIMAATTIETRSNGRRQARKDDERRPATERCVTFKIRKLEAPALVAPVTSNHLAASTHTGQTIVNPRKKSTRTLSVVSTITTKPKKTAKM
jgi:hypothetical protein